MSTKKRPQSPEDIALWRLAILGPLVSARLEHGDRRTHFTRAAELEYEKPDGERVHVAARTIEDWYYAYLEGGWKALMPSARDDRGTSRAIRPEIAAKLIAAKRKKPRRSIGLLIKCFVRLLQANALAAFHAALIVAHSRDQVFLDDSVVAAAIADLSHELPTNPDTLKPRTQTGTRSRR